MLETTNSPARLPFPVIGVIIAIAATTTMDATGLSNFSAFALLPLIFIFWFLERMPAANVGFKIGRIRDYNAAILFPIVAIGLVACLAAVTGSMNVANSNWNKAILNLVILTISTFLVAIVTEEGFFRGWLWGSLRQRGVAETRVLIWTSIAFALWHISAATIAPDFRPPKAQVPIFLLNAAVLGAAWGILRAMSGSILVSSASHGLWNGIVYVLFGFGTKHGALGITNSALFGPEIGFAGLVMNLMATAALWHWWRTRSARD